MTENDVKRISESESCSSEDMSLDDVYRRVEDDSIRMKKRPAEKASGMYKWVTKLHSTY